SDTDSLPPSRGEPSSTVTRTASSRRKNAAASPEIAPPTITTCGRPFVGSMPPAWQTLISGTYRRATRRPRPCRRHEPRGGETVRIAWRHEAARQGPRKRDSGHTGTISITDRARRASWNAMKPRIQRVLAQWKPESSASGWRAVGVRRASVLVLAVRDLGAAGLLRDRDQRGGTALLPAAVTTACGKHRGTPGTASWPAS